MSEKHELVEKVLRRLEQVRVTTDGVVPPLTIRSQNNFWAGYPEGYYNDEDFDSVEARLSCLSAESLQRILGMELVTPGRNFNSIWNYWGQHGVFKCDPEILYRDGMPVLRIRHDSYVGIGYAGFFHSKWLGSDSRQKTSLFELAGDVDLCKALKADSWWPATAEGLCRVIILAHILSAYGGNQSFFKLLQKSPEWFDTLSIESDKRVLKIGLWEDYTWEDLRRKLCETWAYGEILHEFLVMSQGRQVALLRLRESFVEVLWSRCGMFKKLTLMLPGYNRPFAEKWAEESGIEFSMDDFGVYRKKYLETVWTRAAVTLLGMTGIWFSEDSVVPIKGYAIDSSEVILAPPENRLSGLNDLREKLQA